MTDAAQDFISPLTLQALSGHAVHTTLLDPQAEAAMGHIELAKWADAIVIAPASADVIARLACGMANDLLTTLCLASSASLAIAPAMNQAMWSHPQTQANIAHLQQRGVSVFGPGAGSQACGDVGMGRMLEVHELVEACQGLFVQPLLQGKQIVITAGPTREAMDPVRYITNHSSGKMGFALAAAAARLGARVSLIAGPVNITTPSGVNRIEVISADDMLAACLAACSDADVFIASAAVADYRLAHVAKQKIKKSGETLTLELVRNPDIVQTVANLSTARPFVVGFAAETNNMLAYASDKLERKKLDMIIANNVAEQGIGFNSDDNAVTVLNQQGILDEITRCSKTSLAQRLILLIAQQITT